MSLDEVYATIETIMEQRRNDHTFMAALQGIDLNKERSSEKDEDPVEAVKKRAAAKLENEQRTMQLIASGMSVEDAREESIRLTEMKEMADLGMEASEGW